MKKLLAVTLLATVLSAHAEFFDGNELHKHLNDKDMQGIAAGYILGVHDAMRGVTICTPPNTTGVQIRDIVKQWLESNPTLRHHNADVIVQAVLAEIFPCKKTEKKPTVTL